MTHHLILIRHAKSSWNDPYADDHARVLNARGRAAAVAIGEWLAERGHVPDVVLCSDAARTKETAALILPAFKVEPALHLSPLLYHAAPATILDLIRALKGKTVAVIAHNPGIGMVASALVATPPDHHRFDDYPTCATTVIEFDSDWAGVKPRSGRCVDFIVPRDLIGAAGRDAD